MSTNSFRLFSNNLKTSLEGDFLYFSYMYLSVIVFLYLHYLIISVVTTKFLTLLKK